MGSTRSREPSHENGSDGHIVIYNQIENTDEGRLSSEADEEVENGVRVSTEIHSAPDSQPLLPRRSRESDGVIHSLEQVQTLEILHHEEATPRVDEGEREPDRATSSSILDGAKSAWESFRSKFFSTQRDDVSTSIECNDDDIEHGIGSSSSSGSGGADKSSRASPGAVCLICLDALLPEDFESGKAISLECGCRGDLALRHKECAIKWSQVKDDGRGGLPICELCKKPVQNLPELPVRPPEQRDAENIAITIEEAYFNDPSHFQQFVPSRADLVFDCIRVTWIAMIISILFFDASIEVALWTGLVAGAAYILMLRLLYKQHFEAMRAYAEQHAAAAGQRQQHTEVQNV